MIIKATKKVFNQNRLKPKKADNESLDTFPGEWYVDLFSLGSPGKLGLIYVHSPSFIPILMPGKSLKQNFDMFLFRVEFYLIRNGYKDLIDQLSLQKGLIIGSY